MEDVIVFIMFIEFGFFISLMCFMIIENDMGLCDSFICISIQFINCNYIFQFGLVFCISVNQIYMIVIIL